MSTTCARCLAGRHHCRVSDCTCSVCSHQRLPRGLGAPTPPRSAPKARLERREESARRALGSGGSLGRSTISKAVAERAVELLRSGMSQRKMGAALGLDRTTVMGAIARYGLDYHHPTEGDN